MRHALPARRDIQVLALREMAYRSQRLRDVDRARRKAQANRQKLTGNRSLLEPSPTKLPWMRWRTYGRLYAHAQLAQAKVFERVAKLVRR
jgi:hypothetical protein